MRLVALLLFLCCSCVTLRDPSAYCQDHGDQYSTAGECYADVNEMNAAAINRARVLEATATVLQGASEEMRQAQQTPQYASPRPVNCVSNRVGNYVYTTCN